MVQALMELAYVSTHFLSSRNCSRNTMGLIAKKQVELDKDRGSLVRLCGLKIAQTEHRYPSSSQCSTYAASTLLSEATIPMHPG